ncbi:MAG TPA: 2TM domain-containing protein, partial [Smithella sp.]|nr:2TM domain-containing protein [Smithella sp.]
MTSRRAKIGLGYHLAAFAAVNAVLVWINLDTSPEYFWAKWPLAGWAVALSYHAFSVFSSLIKAHKG